MDTDTARQLLADERARLTGLLDGLPQQSTDRPDSDPTEQGADAASSQFDDEMRDTIAEDLRAELREVELAEQRLERGEYGICEASGEPIPDERLRAQPATRFRVEHQEAEERRAEAGGPREGADPTL